jgi:hypothetical protein
LQVHTLEHPDSPLSPPLFFAAAGEGQTPPPLFLSPLVRRGLTELVLPQVFVPGAFRSRAPTTPERRPTRRRCQAPPPSHPLRIRARLPLLRTVSNIPRSISRLLVHFGVLTSSPERPRRPLPVPAVHGARAPPLTPLPRANAPSLRFAPARASFGALQRVLEPGRRALRRTPPYSGEPRRHSRLHTFWVVRSLIHGADQILGIPLRCGSPWTRASGARLGPPHTRASVAVGSEIHGAAMTFSLKSP